MRGTRSRSRLLPPSLGELSTDPCLGSRRERWIGRDRMAKGNDQNIAEGDDLTDSRSDQRLGKSEVSGRA
jgi:hypothetical protein